MDYSRTPITRLIFESPDFYNDRDIHSEQLTLSNPPMNYSGIVITAAPSEFAAVLAALRQTDGIEIHQTDSATGRTVAVIEAADTDAEADIFNAVRRLPGVIDVSLVNHYFEEEVAHEGV